MLSLVLNEILLILPTVKDILPILFTQEDNVCSEGHTAHTLTMHTKCVLQLRRNKVYGLVEISEVT